MAQVHGIILLVIAALEFMLCIYLLYTNIHDEIRRWYAIFVFCVMLWVIGNSGGIFTDNMQIANLTNKLSWAGPIMLAPALLFLSWIFPYKTKNVNYKNWIIFFSPIIFFMILLFAPILPIMISTNMDEWRTVNFGPGLHLFNTFFLIYWFWAMYNFYKKYKNADGIHKWQLKYLLYGMLLSSAYGIILNLIMPWLNFSDWPTAGAIGAEASIIWLGFTAYIMFKKNIKHI